MIDWFAVLSNAVWVLGLAIVLATFSYFDWWRGRRVPKQAWRQVLADSRFQGFFSLGMALFSAGLALSGNRWWTTAAWAVLALVFIALALLSGRAARSAMAGVSQPPAEDEE